MHLTLPTKIQHTVLPRQISQIFGRYTVQNWCSPSPIYFSEVLLQPVANSILFLMGICNMNNSKNLLCCSAYTFLGKKRKLPPFSIQYFRLPIKVKSCSNHPSRSRIDFHCFTEVRQHRADLKWSTMTSIIFKLTTEGRNPPDLIISPSKAAPPWLGVSWTLWRWYVELGRMNSGPLLPSAKGRKLIIMLILD